MGGRMMKRWIVLPLKDEQPINQRLQAVAYLKDAEQVAYEIGERLKEIGDIERLISKVAVGKVNPKEVMQLRRTLAQIEPIQSNRNTSGVATSAEIGSYSYLALNDPGP
jgi:DNA mismatch repair protein MutS